MVLVDLEGKTRVTKNNIMYKCGWSPFEGYIFNSSILKTWVNGKLLYNEGKIIESGPAKSLEYIMNTNSWGQFQQSPTTCV